MCNKIFKSNTKVKLMRFFNISSSKNNDKGGEPTPPNTHNNIINLKMVLIF